VLCTVERCVGEREGCVQWSGVLERERAVYSGAVCWRERGQCIVVRCVGEREGCVQWCCVLAG
jgi:hypothetical protein